MQGWIEYCIYVTIWDEFVIQHKAEYEDLWFPQDKKARELRKSNARLRMPGEGCTLGAAIYLDSYCYSHFNGHALLQRASCAPVCLGRKSQGRGDLCHSIHYGKTWVFGNASELQAESEIHEIAEVTCSFECPEGIGFSQLRANNNFISTLNRRLEINYWFSALPSPTDDRAFALWKN